MLLSTAIALAEETCCFDDENIAPHPVPQGIHEDLSISGEWSRSLSLFLQLASENLALRLGLDPLLPQDERHDLRDRLPQDLAADNYWEGVVDLMEITSRARGQLQAGRKREPTTRLNETLLFLRRTSRALERWRKQNNMDSIGRSIASLRFGMSASDIALSARMFSSSGLPRPGIPLHSTVLLQPGRSSVLRL